MTNEPIFLPEYLQQLETRRNAIEKLDVQSPELNAAIEKLKDYQSDNSGEHEREAGLTAELIIQRAENYKES